MKNIPEYYIQFADRRKITKTFLLIAIFTSFFLGIASQLSEFLLGSITFLGLGVVTIFLYLLHHKGYYKLAGHILVGILPIVTTYLIIIGNGLNDLGILGYPISLVVAFLIGGRRAIFASTTLNIVLASFVFWIEQRGFIFGWTNDNIIVTSRFEFVVLLTLMFVLSYFMWVIMGMIERNIQAVVKSEAQVKNAYDLTLEGWATALELRDKETEGHSRGVTELTLEFSQLVGVTEDLIHIRRGALLHDIGKMGIPDEILKKEEPLTESDWEIIKKHPILAYEMLKNIEYLKLAMDIPCFHHEQWDGLGYPQGLAGEEIPIAARIFSLVDNWDALTSDRPYRLAWSEEKTKEYIFSESGKKFDPELVPQFIELISKT